MVLDRAAGGAGSVLAVCVTCASRGGPLHDTVRIRMGG